MKRSLYLGAITVGAMVALAGCAAPAPDADLDDARDLGVSMDGDAYSTTREGAAGLQGYTVYRPADLNLFEEHSVPVLVWGNGACDVSNINVTGFLTGIAAQGYIVVAVGGPAQRTEYDIETEDEYRKSTGPLIDAIDWVTEDPIAQEQFLERANTDAIGATGWSCGGLQALTAATEDERIDAVVGVSTGFFEEADDRGWDRSIAEKITVPTLVFHGGTESLEYENAIATYERLTGPAALVGFEPVGHSGLLMGWDMSTGWDDPYILPLGYSMVTDWFDYALKGDADAQARFDGQNCGICEQDSWSVETKNLD